ncbi:MAG: YCF48-related protein [Opitutaceae bacterium]|nr:YCF48-related protein [Opitutaceae bacterium]
MTASIILAAWSVTALPAAGSDPVTALAARSLLLDAQTFGPTVIAVGAGGHILRSADGGSTWELARVPAQATLTGIHFPDDRHGWAVGHDALILHSEDGGLTWARQYQGENLQDSFLDVCFLDAQTGFAVGAYGLFLATADGGRTWSPRRIIEEDYFLNRISAGPGGTLYIAGEHGTLMRSTDRGATWVPIPAPYDGSFYGLLPLGPKALLACGLRGRIYRSEDDGDTWQPVPNEQRVLLATAGRLRSGLIVLAGQARVFLVSRDDGRSFAPWSPGLTTGVAELVVAPDGGLLAFGEEGVIHLPAP